MIFGGTEACASKRRVKVTERKVFAASPAVPSYLRWSESAITFDRSDHLDHVPYPGKFPLVVAPIINKKRLTKVQIDGGSMLNTQYVDTLDALGIDRSMIRPERASFYGVVPDKLAIPQGQVMLPVTFGDRSNFRTENLCFKVVDFNGSYHAILGRPCYVKFLVVPNYVYRKLKMPGPNGIITVCTSPQVAYWCEVESCELASALIASTELVAARAGLVDRPDHDVDASAPKKAAADSRPDEQFKPRDDIKRVPIDPQGSGSKIVLIAATLSQK